MPQRTAISRRTFLRVAAVGGGLGLLGVGRAVRVGLLPRSQEPYEAWSALDHAHGPRAIVAAAVLAANPHNSQPWKFRLGDNAIDLYLDLPRSLGPVDPFLRQMHIGVGCALENLCIGATMQGLGASPVLFPDRSDATLAARVTLSGVGSAPSPHAAAILRRHTNRGAYDVTSKLDARVQAALQRQVRTPDTTLALYEASSATGRAFAETILASTQALIADKVLIRASDKWFRWTPREVSEHRDGPSLESFGIPSPVRIVAQLGPQLSAESVNSSWLTATRETHLATAPAFGVIAVRDATRPEQLLEAGRLWQRVHLEATLQGLGMQPLDQWLEVADRARQLGTALPVTPRAPFAADGFTPVMMFRAGVPRVAALPSARRRLDDVLVAAAS